MKCSHTERNHTKCNHTTKCSHSKCSSYGIVSSHASSRVGSLLVLAQCRALLCGRERGLEVVAVKEFRVEHLGDAMMVVVRQVAMVVVRQVGVLALAPAAAVLLVEPRGRPVSLAEPAMRVHRPVGVRRERLVRAPLWREQSRRGLPLMRPVSRGRAAVSSDGEAIDHHLGLHRLRDHRAHPVLARLLLPVPREVAPLPVQDHRRRRGRGGGGLSAGPTHWHRRRRRGQAACGGGCGGGDSGGDGGGGGGGSARRRWGRRGRSIEQRARLRADGSALVVVVIVVVVVVAALDPSVVAAGGVAHLDLAEDREEQLVRVVRVELLHLLPLPTWLRVGVGVGVTVRLSLSMRARVSMRVRVRRVRVRVRARARVGCCRCRPEMRKMIESSSAAAVYSAPASLGA